MGINWSQNEVMNRMKSNRNTEIGDEPKNIRINKKSTVPKAGGIKVEEVEWYIVHRPSSVVVVGKMEG